MRSARTPSLPELQAFAAAARAGTATGAGAVLGLTQSAVSRSISTLEARLGVRLFHRERQRLRLSDAGRAFLPEAERVLATLDRAALTVMAFGGHRRVLRIACLPTFASLWLIPRLPQMGPEVTFDISTTLAPLDFDRDPRDAAILRGPLPRGQNAMELAPDRLVAVAAPALLPDGPLPDADLPRLPLLQQATRADLWLDWFRDAGIDPIRLLRGPRFEQFGMVLAAARAGMGVALVPEILAAQEIAAGALRPASTRRLDGGAPYLLVWPDRTSDLPAFTAFRAALAPALVAEPAAPH
ncbi:MAG: LysR family transcriptional regulator [Paracoccaceae bacterium]|nr:MAG: LysR family transcriptional regulator [Paracoccaceae bacterium]